MHDNYDDCCSVNDDINIHCKPHSNYRDVKIKKEVHLRIDEITFLFGPLTVFKRILWCLQIVLLSWFRAPLPLSLHTSIPIRDLLKAQKAISSQVGQRSSSLGESQWNFLHIPLRKPGNQVSTFLRRCFESCHNCDLQASEVDEGKVIGEFRAGEWCITERFEISCLDWEGSKISHWNDLLPGCQCLLGALLWVERSRSCRRWNSATAVGNPIRGSRSLVGVIGLLWSCRSEKWTSEKWQRNSRNLQRTWHAIQREHGVLEKRATFGIRPGCESCIPHSLSVQLGERRLIFEHCSLSFSKNEIAIISMSPGGLLGWTWKWLSTVDIQEMEHINIISVLCLYQTRLKVPKRCSTRPWEHWEDSRASFPENWELFDS